MKLEIEEIAIACHEANRALCIAFGDDSQESWDRAPAWQRDSAMTGVKFAQENPRAGPDSSHNSWSEEKLADGWVFGETRDAAAKTHPCLVPFDQLPPQQQAKDYVFRAIVLALTE